MIYWTALWQHPINNNDKFYIFNLSSTTEFQWLSLTNVGSPSGPSQNSKGPEETTKVLPLSL